jgi:hypothetical protein
MAARSLAFALALALTSIAGCASLAGSGSAGRYDFAIIGDMPYTRVQEQEYQRVLAALNAADLAFVAHVGDFQFDARPYNANPSLASMPCVDESYQAIYESFQGVRHPLVLTPGDNDWADCAPLKARKVDPLALLEKVRATFYPTGRSLGQRTMPVVNQSSDPQFAKFRENLRWSVGGVVFATVHIVGSNDNTGHGPQTDAEQAERKAANIAWLKAAFDEASAPDKRGLVIVTQANPGFENFWPPSAKTRYFLPFIARGQPLPKPETPFGDYVKTLSDALETFGKPMLSVHGDTHLFRIDKPLYSAKTQRAFENFTRVETFGWPDTHWVRITVDPADPQLFQVEPRIVPGNAASRRAK